MADPGVSREQRISEEGLARLERHLKLGTKINKQVLQQWVSRYGDVARKLLKNYGYEVDE